MNEGISQSVRVAASLRAHARELLEAKSAAAIVAALERFAGRSGLGLECVIAIGTGKGSDVPARFVGRVSRARRAALKALKPFHAHPFVAETLAAGGPLTGNEIRKRRSLTQAAWRAALPPVLRNREMLSVAVRARGHGAWFVAFGLRGGGANGFMRSAVLVAAQLTYERFRAVAEPKRKPRLK